jgi:chemotaxis protein methyltransferase CheR
MNKTDFEFYRKLLLEKSGLSLTPDKTYLLNARLELLVRAQGLSSLNELTAGLRVKPDPRTVALVAEAMATKETSFFRDIKPFSSLKETLFPALVKKNAAKKTIRIWSAACATGQEPYSIAMTVREFFQAHPGWQVQILATDFSAECLERAKSGLYSQFEIQRGLTVRQMLENFTQEGTDWRVRDPVKRMVSFSAFNLLEPMAGLGSFDVIFCRNVLIYFDAATRKLVLNRLAERLNPGGYLLLGACESVLGLAPALLPCPELPGAQVAVRPLHEQKEPAHKPHAHKEHGHGKDHAHKDAHHKGAK